jgi:NTP pyrophosphatase (non-canonical NTP hydrolase)
VWIGRYGAEEGMNLDHLNSLYESRHESQEAWTRWTVAMQEAWPEMYRGMSETVVRRELTFAAFRAANVARCAKWHPAGIASWSPSDWLTAVTGELGELASLLKMRNRERDGLPGNKFSPTNKQIADEVADVLTYLDLLAEVLGVDLGRAATEKFNEVSERVGFTDRIPAADAAPKSAAPPESAAMERFEHVKSGRVYRLHGPALRESDQESMMVYESEKDGVMWVRPASEFYDGRFRVFVASSPPTEQKEGK